MQLPWTVILLVLLSLLIPSSPLQAQAIQEVVTPETEIAQGYETWSLFLICNPSWARPDAYEQLENMWQAFTGFGRAIGDNHLAVWFWRRQPRWGSAELVEDVDVERATRYCDLYDLRPSRSPHVLVTTSYPTLEGRVEEFGTVELAGGDPQEIEQFLISLADALYADDIASLVPGSESFWFRLFQAIRAPIRRLGEDVSVSIHSGPLQLQWSGGGR
jgi:hypothetical protein